jgi:ABC-type polysaccharide/polyol phosphate export permease
MSGEAQVEASIRISAHGQGAPGSLWPELRESLRSPEFWALSSWLDILVRARRSRLGLLWLLVPSLVYVFGVGTFFQSMRGGDPGEFYAHVALGAAIFRTLMSSITSSANVFHSNYSFIMDGHMRLADYVLEALAKSFFDLCMYLPALVAALAMYGHASPGGLLFSLPALVLLYINGLWIATLFGLAGARFPDFGPLLNTMSIFLYLLTPIIWHPDQVPGGSIRAKLMLLNPFYHFIELFRAPIMGQTIHASSIWYVAIMTVCGLVVATLAYRRYARFVPLWI